MAEIDPDVKANYRALHREGRSWKQMAEQVTDRNLAAWFRAEAAAEGPLTPPIPAKGPKRTAEGAG